ncbi:MAG: hypothetical protein QM640_16570 [Niabella sp.]
MKRFILISTLFVIAAGASGQISGIKNRISSIKNAGSGNDSLGKRSQLEDSITISYRFLDTARVYRLDSTLNDFTVKYPIPADYYHLGVTGNAAQSFLFSPTMKAGWDAGFHAFDIYKYTIDKARFFTTTRPYSELTYLLGTRSEQYIELMHTQNIMPEWNVHFQYRLINAPGVYKNQNASHNNYLITSWYQSKKKRYNNYFIIAANKLKNGENGGIDTALNYLDDPDYSDRFTIPTKLGGDGSYSTNFFNTNVTTGNKYDDFNALLRQQYDFGQKDSIVTDSTVVPLFFPRIRLEHTIRYSAYKYMFVDDDPDTDYYEDRYGISVSSAFERQDYWKELMNDFSIYSFPDAKNTQQFIKLGAAVQNLKGIFRDAITTTTDSIHYSDDITTTGYNIIGHGEYRNRSKNQRWDILARGKIYFAGMNAGDYEAAASIQSLLGKKIGSLQLGFENVNRSPSYITNQNSAFYYMTTAVDLKKENSTHLYANIYQPLLKLGLSGHYYLVNNLVYYTDYYKINQASLFNVLQIAVHKTFATGKQDQWKWLSDVYFQQVVGNGPVNVPAVFTRNRFMYEGSLGFKHLNIAMGLDTRYRTNYKGNNYSPLIGQFFYQDSQTVKYKLPDIAAFVHFRINSFKAFVRAENLNAFRILDGTAGFTNNNLAAPEYPYPGLMIRFGIYWGFIN